MSPAAPARPRVSVVMPALDPDPGFFEQALRSLLGQTIAEIEVLVVEAGSSPALETVPDRLGDPRVKRLPASRPSLVEQRNLGLHNATSDLVAFLDVDDVAAPKRFERQIKFLTDHPGVAVLGSRLVIIDAAGRPIGSRTYPTTHLAIVRQMPHSNAIAGPSVMVRRDVVLEGGGFQYDRFGGMAEDYELWSRLARAGVHFANLDEYLTFYRVHPRATKARRTRDHLRATIDIKTMYWADRMGAAGRLRLIVERLMTYAPPALVYRAFGLFYAKSPPGVVVPFLAQGTRGDP